MKKTYDWNAVAVYILHVFLELLQLRNMCYKAVLLSIHSQYNRRDSVVQHNT